MSMVMVGDAVIHGSVYLAASIGNNNYDFKNMFSYIGESIKDYDLKYYNQETIIGGKNLGVSHYPRFNSPDEIGSDLVDLGFNIVSLANNHSMDKNEAGILHSNEFWKSQNIVTAGTYSTEEERNNIPVHEQNGIKYAFLSYTMATNGIPVPKDYLVNVYSDEKAKNDIEKIKDLTDVIIVAMHWGNEYTFTPNDEQIRVANYLSDLGVNLIIGNHPHVIQPISYVNDTLVIYSLGNFISAQHSLGIDKIIGMMVGVTINVEEDKVTFTDLNHEFIYTYCTSGYKNFKVIPFSRLDSDSLRVWTIENKENLEKRYEDVVNMKVG